tara:strand:+ start:2886 stop:3701 length:816 start_codon:yes stop_codon:yes gene_type:complete
MLTEEQIQSFNDNGYIVLDNFFTSDELHQVHQEIRSIVKSFVARTGIANEDSFDLDASLEYLEKKDHDLVAEIYDTICMSPSFLRLQFKKEMQLVANQLLGKKEDDPLYVFKNRIRIDPPMDDRRTYGWHQETFYTIPRSNFVQTWAPVIRNTTVENGTIQLAEGSHKFNEPMQKWVESPDRAIQIVCPDEEVSEKYKTFSVEMNLGQVVFFSGKTFHKSGTNSSKDHRFSMISIWHDIANPDFSAPKIDFSYRKETPKQFFNHFMNERAQ